MSRLQRRAFLGGIVATFAAPAIVRAGVLMPVKPMLWTPPTATEIVMRFRQRYFFDTEEDARLYVEAIRDWDYYAGKLYRGTETQ
jgi:hypothetical protein